MSRKNIEKEEWASSGGQAEEKTDVSVPEKEKKTEEEEWTSTGETEEVEKVGVSKEEIEEGIEEGEEKKKEAELGETRKELKREYEKEERPLTKGEERYLEIIREQGDPIELSIEKIGNTLKYYERKRQEISEELENMPKRKRDKQFELEGSLGSQKIFRAAELSDLKKKEEDLQRKLKEVEEDIEKNRRVKIELEKEREKQRMEAEEEKIREEKITEEGVEEITEEKEVETRKKERKKGLLGRFFGKK